MDEQSDITIRDRIKAKLQAAFAPDFIEVIDESHKHASHAHAMKQPGAAGTHFHVNVVSEAFKGKSLVERHRAINYLLSSEFDAGVHALAIDAKAPGE